MNIVIPYPVRSVSGWSTYVRLMAFGEMVRHDSYFWRLFNVDRYTCKENKTMYVYIYINSTLSWISAWDIIDGNPNSKVHVANIGPTWVLSAPDGPQVGPMNLTIMEYLRNMLTFLVLRLEYYGISTWILWLLIPWWLLSPGHQQPWYWLCTIVCSMNDPLSIIRKYFKYLCHPRVGKW